MPLRSDEWSTLIMVALIGLAMATFAILNGGAIDLAIMVIGFAAAYVVGQWIKRRHADARRRVLRWFHLDDREDPA